MHRSICGAGSERSIPLHAADNSFSEFDRGELISPDIVLTPLNDTLYDN
jgi:hypothetical protein